MTFHYTLLDLYCQSKIIHVISGTYIYVHLVLYRPRSVSCYVETTLRNDWPLPCQVLHTLIMIWFQKNKTSLGVYFSVVVSRLLFNREEVGHLHRKYLMFLRQIPIKSNMKCKKLNCNWIDTKLLSNCRT